MYPMLTFSIDGSSQFLGVFSDLTAVTTIPKELITPPKEATHYVHYTTGSVAAIAALETLNGGTSLASAIVVAKVVLSGAPGTSNEVGILFLRDISGIFQAETLTGGTSTGTAVIAQAPIRMKFAGMHAKRFLGIVETATLGWSVDGTIPTVSGGTNNCLVAFAGSTLTVDVDDNIDNLKMINATASSGTKVRFTLFW